MPTLGALARAAPVESSCAPPIISIHIPSLSLDLNLQFLYWLAKYRSQPRLFGRRPRCSPGRSDIVLLPGSFKKTVVMDASSSSPAPSGFSPRNLPPPLTAAPRRAAHRRHHADRKQNQICSSSRRSSFGLNLALRSSV
ncbi:hypothetical protein U1Q18_007312 [Sarracenia purpurea var. burkii]